jgi:hypothetical protein
VRSNHTQSCDRTTLPKCANAGARRACCPAIIHAARRVARASKRGARG